MSKKQYILMPKYGIKARIDTEAIGILKGLPVTRSTAKSRSASLPFGASSLGFDIIDTISEDGPKLVNVEEKAVEEFNRTERNLRMMELVTYSAPLNRVSTKHTINPLSTVTIEVLDNNGQPVKGAEVFAYTNFASNYGADGFTNAHGKVSFSLTGITIERLYIYPPTGYWGAYRENVVIQPALQFQVEEVVPGYTDAIRHLYPKRRFNQATGVKVGVIDTGIGSHNDLNLAGGMNTVTGEPANDYHDAGIHGTHVAGIIGAINNQGLRGMAPGIDLYSYRVFDNALNNATNYAIMKAMILAATIHRCDIINLSLGGAPSDPIVEEAMTDARNAGMLIVAAAGNDGRKAVNYPASYHQALAVSAMGVQGKFPSGSLEESEVLYPPNGTNPNEFIYSDSNIGPEIAMTAPGVGCLSTLPGNAYGPLSGTSMASPVVAGAAASLLSNDTATFNMLRNAQRASRIERLLQTNCVKRGFGANYEGFGLPDPTKV